MKIAIIGAGQLAKMLAEAGIKIGHSFSFLANPEEDVCCVKGLGSVIRIVKDSSAEALYNQLGSPDVVTVEKEQVDTDLLSAFESFCLVYPSIQAIAVTQNRIEEKKFLDSINVPVAPYKIAQNAQELESIVSSVKGTVYVKHPHLGYDGKNQWKVSQPQDLKTINIPAEFFPLIVEESVDFLYETSLIGVRSAKGEIKVYGPTKNLHKNGILIQSNSLNERDGLEDVLNTARTYLDEMLNKWNYVGVLTLELFKTPSNVLVNEIAPRVHNSGHWTMDGCESSQFENHIRAITGMPLGDTHTRQSVGMVNLLGVDSIADTWREYDGCQVYWYNKTVKPMRKMGHANFIHSKHEKSQYLQDQLVDHLYGP